MRVNRTEKRNRDRRSGYDRRTQEDRRKFDRGTPDRRQGERRKETRREDDYQEEKRFDDQIEGRNSVLELLESGDENARNMLIEHNLRLVVYIAKRYETNPVHMEDLISIGIFGLIKAIHTFKRDKNIKLVTYASRCIENEILMHLRKKSKRKLEVSFDEPLNVDYDGNELVLSDILGTQGDIVAEEFEKIHSNFERSG